MGSKNPPYWLYKASGRCSVCKRPHVKRQLYAPVPRHVELCTFDGGTVSYKPISMSEYLRVMNNPRVIYVEMTPPRQITIDYLER